MDRTPHCLAEDGEEVNIHDLNYASCDIASAREGDVPGLKALYDALKRDPKILDTMDKIPFFQTPLHEVAVHTPRDEARQAHLALELLNLKPSFGRKLNTDGLSPLHLAVRERFSGFAKQLIKWDRELIRVKGMEGQTPLHCVAEIGDTETNLLAEFLCACPESINDLTIRNETALHIAVKHGQVKAFKVIFQWIWKTYNGELLIRKDEDGNTVLHIAASTNQLEAPQPWILLGRGGLRTYSRGVQKLHQFDHEEYASLKENNPRLDEFLLSKEPFFDHIVRCILHLRKELSLDMRSMVILVATLIATATFEALKSDLKSEIKEEQSSSSSSTEPLANLGKMTYYVLNTLSFTASIAVMISVLSLRPFTSFLHTSLVFLAMSYGYKLLRISWGQAVFSRGADSAGLCLQVTIVRERVVLVATYVETPRRRRFSSNHRRRHRYRASNGTDRRSDLLNYSRRLRESGRLEPAAPLLLHPKPESSSSNNRQHPMKQDIQRNYFGGIIVTRETSQYDLVDHATTKQVKAWDGPNLFGKLQNGGSKLSQVSNSLQICREFKGAVEDEYILEQVSIMEFPVIHQWLKSEKVSRFLNQCMEGGNPEALYRQGMVDYFSSMRMESGLENLKRASEKGHLKASYVYGILLMCMEGQSSTQGLKLLNAVKTSNSKSTRFAIFQECWERIEGVIHSMWINNHLVGRQRRSCCHKNTNKVRQHGKGDAKWRMIRVVKVVN
ncbi:hypothetical protein Vadar_000138 [Vaccinium darrowii]|uniref:Uncharacterized protein n=1 Tax=Vaccinium darrowii TaxID=229202 RepID=A0ACB7YTV4_9ERIC|nr:hypothetical protein Vadar_000138 [Vaccinium darrowii]